MLTDGVQELRAVPLDRAADLDRVRLERAEPGTIAAPRSPDDTVCRVLDPILIDRIGGAAGRLERLHVLLLAVAARHLGVRTAAGHLLLQAAERRLPGRGRLTGEQRRGVIDRHRERQAFTRLLR